MQEKETVYLAGKITGDPEYRAKFERAQRKLENSGFIVINPAGLPSEGFAYEAYMRMSGAMLAECDAVCFLPDWMDSNLEALCQDCHNKEHHRKDKKRRYMFDEEGNLISPPIRRKFREGETPRAGG